MYIHIYQNLQRSVWTWSAGAQQFLGGFISKLLRWVWISLRVIHYIYESRTFCLYLDLCGFPLQATLSSIFFFDKSWTICMSHELSLFLSCWGFSSLSYSVEFECVMPHIRMRHVTHTNESCHIYEWVISHMWVRPVTLMNEACHAYDWVMLNVYVRHFIYMNESCRTSHSIEYIWVI